MESLYIVLLIYLVIESRRDIRKKEISVKNTAGFAIAALLLRVGNLGIRLVTGNITIKSIGFLLTALAPGFFAGTWTGNQTGHRLWRWFDVAGVWVMSWRKNSRSSVNYWNVFDLSDIAISVTVQKGKKGYPAAFCTVFTGCLSDLAGNRCLNRIICKTYRKNIAKNK